MPGTIASGAKTPAMLKGILRCGHCGTSMGATFARKGGKTYRYHLCLHARKTGYDSCPLRTLPAGDIEALVVSQVQRVLQAPEIVGRVCRVVREAGDPDSNGTTSDVPTDAEVISRLRDFEFLWDELYPGEQARIVGLAVREAVVWGDHLDLVFHDRGIAVLAAEITGSPDIVPGETLTLIIDFSTRQYGGRKQVILPDGTTPIDPTNTAPDPRAVAIARAHAWMEAMEGGKFRTLTQLAQAVGVDEGYVRRQMIEVWDNSIFLQLFASPKSLLSFLRHGTTNETCSTFRHIQLKRRPDHFNPNAFLVNCHSPRGIIMLWLDYS